ncbi:SDR family NAD(P)-dependent oxidoreductase [uncultured Acinetobacter sp.]|uniref:SDR family NAD(P)-dependent oxidoreductase n=1 Tax=uncultured Acinetobacter sp. TaxID=165433 RepID=UPI00374A2A26
MNWNCVHLKKDFEVNMIRKKIKPCAVVFGIDDSKNIAAAIAILSAQNGLHVYLAGENQSALNEVTSIIQHMGGSASSKILINIDSTAINLFFEHIEHAGYRPAFVVHGNQGTVNQSALNTSVSEIEYEWYRQCFSGFLIGQMAIQQMLTFKQGTLLFLGHLTSTNPVKGKAAFAAAGAGLRSFAQSMAREFGPKGIHVTHVLLDDTEISGRELNARAVADTCWQLYCQHKTAWTHELDIRP